MSAVLFGGPLNLRIRAADQVNNPRSPFATPHPQHSTKKSFLNPEIINMPLTQTVAHLMQDEKGGICAHH
jgi:hypothetical protein